MKDSVDVREATHVRLKNGRIEKIVSKWGIGSDGSLEKPSGGRFRGRDRKRQAGEYV